MWSFDEEMQRLRRKLTLVRLVTGTVRDGVVVPDLELPEGTRVSVSLEEPPASPDDEDDEPEQAGFEAWAETRRARALERRNARLFHELAQCDLP